MVRIIHSADRKATVNKMALTKAEIEKLATLSRLRFSDEEIEGFTHEMEDIIAFADTINNAVEGNTDDIKATADNAVPFYELREDEVLPSTANEKILSCVNGENGFFYVKRCVQ